MTKKIDINCDLGELHPVYGTNNDIELMPYISSCNICCGFHSSNPEIIQSTIKESVAHGIKIGAHPSYHDKTNFGRKSIKQSQSSLLADILYQVSALKSMTEYYGQQLHHVKAHGALYHDIHKNEELGDAYVKLIKDIDPRLKIMGLADASLKLTCIRHDVEYINEVFADRRYHNKFELLNREHPDAVIKNEDAMKSQLTKMMSGKITDISGTEYNITVDSICIHSDNDHALSHLKCIHALWQAHLYD